MRVITAAGLAGALLAVSVSAQAREVMVTTEADSGSGSFRAAIDEANVDPTVSAVVFDPDLEVQLESVVEYTGPQDLDILGDDSTVTGDFAVADPPEGYPEDFEYNPDFCLASLFASTGGGSLSFADIGFEDSPGHGLCVQVPGDATDDVSVTLYKVEIDTAIYHGLWLDENQFTPVSVSLFALRSSVESAGIGEGLSDFDGYRVDETGDGSILARIVGNEIIGNGADGVELDERGNGDVDVRLSRSEISENGFLDPADLDDGLDVDEAGDGSVYVLVSRSDVSRNLDEGIDGDEEGEGDVVFRIVGVTANDNFDEGIKFDEEDGGSIFGKLQRSEVVGNGFGEDGTGDNQNVQLEELGPGTVDVLISGTDATQSGSVANDDGEDIKVEQEEVAGEGPGRLTLRDVDFDAIDTADILLNVIP